MRFSYTPAPAWPRLAWLARCPRRGGTIDVTHGAAVETGEDWFCEAVWDAPFAAGEFDRTDVVYGSGARRRGAVVTFVSAATTVDRLHALDAGDVTWVSNSLPCLAEAANAVPDPAYTSYFTDFRSICLGLERHRRTLATSAGAIRLVYFANLGWDGVELRRQAKPRPLRDFRSFERYRAFLESSLALLGANMAAPERRHHWTWLGTMSSGYDSPTAAALARGAGLAQAIAFDRARGGESDVVPAIAETLGVRLTVLERDAWRAAAAPEIPFLAADAKGEDVYFRSAEALLAGRVLVTGFHGDRVWSRRGARGDGIVRGDQSGLSLTEYRLDAGFLHCAVPFLGVRQAADIARLSRSPELAPWDVGGGYSRPICRRVLEEAGVPRDAFGRHKRAASVLFFERGTFLSPDSLADFGAWLERLPPATWDARLAAWAARAADREPLFRHLFPWALERARHRYAPAAAAAEPAAAAAAALECVR